MYPWDTRDVEVLRQEQELAQRSGVRWQDRGPPGPDLEGPETWRGQRWREGSQRFSNRGGQHREYYAAKYGKGKGQGKDKSQASSSGKGEGKGKDKSQASSSCKGEGKAGRLDRL